VEGGELGGEAGGAVDRLVGRFLWICEECGCYDDASGEVREIVTA